MLKHKVEIRVNKKGDQRSVLTGGEITLRDKALSALFRKGHKMLVLVPADSVQSVAIREIEVLEGADGDE